MAKRQQDSVPVFGGPRPSYGRTPSWMHLRRPTADPRPTPSSRPCRLSIRQRGCWPAARVIDVSAGIKGDVPAPERETRTCTACFTARALALAASLTVPRNMSARSCAEKGWGRGEEEGGANRAEDPFECFCSHCFEIANLQPCRVERGQRDALDRLVGAEQRDRCQGAVAERGERAILTHGAAHTNACDRVWLRKKQRRRSNVRPAPNAEISLGTYCSPEEAGEDPL